MSGSFESVRWNACVQTRPRFIFSSEVWGNGVRTHVNSKGKNPLYRGLRGGSNPHRCVTQDSEPNTLPTELFRPLDIVECPSFLSVLVQHLGLSCDPTFAIHLDSLAFIQSPHPRDHSCGQNGERKIKEGQCSRSQRHTVFLVLIELCMVVCGCKGVTGWLSDESTDPGQSPF